MNTKRYLQFMLAAKAAKAKVPAMDGGPTTNYNGFVDMEAHDRRFHHGHYEEGQTCKLRDMLGRQDVVDMIAPESRDTTREQVEGVITSAQGLGLLDEADHQALLSEFQSIRNAVEGLDDMSDSDMQQLAQRMRDFNAVYNSLAAINAEEAEVPEPEQEQEPEQETEQEPEPTPEPAAETPAPTEPPATPPPAGEQQPPVGGMRHETTAAGTNLYPELRDFANGLWGYEASRRVAALREDPYDWPVQSRNGRITAEQITPELVAAVAAHQAYGTRRRDSTRYEMRRMMEVLANPSGCENGWYHSKAWRILQQGNSPGASKDKKRLRQIFDALHPGYMENREERQRAAREAAEQERLRQQVQNLENAAQAARNDGTLREGVARRVNFTEEDAADAVNQIVARVGEQYRQQVRNAIGDFQRTGNIPREGIGYLNEALPADHPVRRAINEANDRVRMEEERRKSEVQRFRIQDTPETLAANHAVADARGFRMSDTERSPFYGNRDIGYHNANCYCNTVAQRAQKHGIFAKPVPAWSGQENTNHFAKRQMAYAQNFQPVQRENGTVDGARIRELAATMNDGDSFSAWSGGHNVLITKIGDRFYKDDGYYGRQATPLTADEVAGHMTSISSRQYDSEKTSAENGNRDSRARLAMIKYAARHNLVKKGRDINNISPEELDAEMRKTFALGNASFIIPKDAPLLPEEWELIQPA